MITRFTRTNTMLPIQNTFSFRENLSLYLLLLLLQQSIQASCQNALNPVHQCTRPAYIIVRYKLLNGYRLDFRPGWDCHGLPI